MNSEKLKKVFLYILDKVQSQHINIKTMALY